MAESRTGRGHRFLRLTCNGKDVLQLSPDGKPALAECKDDELKRACSDKRLQGMARNRLALEAVRDVCGAAAMPRDTCFGNSFVARLARAQPKRLAAALSRIRKGVVNAEGNLWRIERKSVPASYLYGVVHYLDPRLPPLPKPLVAALEQARLVAVEVDPKLMFAALPKEVIGTPVYLTYGCPFVATQLGGVDPVSMEALLIVLAKQSVQTLTLEPESFEAWTKAQAVDQGSKSSGRSQPGIKTDPFLESDPSGELGATLVDIYAREMAIAFTALLMEQVVLEELESRVVPPAERVQLDRTIRSKTDEFVRRSLAKNRARNETMMAHAAPELAKGNIVIAVGAMHLPGEHGLVQLIRRAGYTVTRVR